MAVLDAPPRTNLVDNVVSVPYHGCVGPLNPKETEMTNANPLASARPVADEYVAYYAQYVNRVPAGAIIDLLEEQLDQTRALLLPLTPAQAAFRPKPEDWSVVEVVGHIADTERVFAYRALSFARGDTTPLPGFDQDLFVATAGFDRRPLLDLLDEFAAVRHTSIALFRGLDEEAWLRRGAANNNPVSVRALAYIIAGHELHHVEDFRLRYNIA
jgi:hypothetical protein